MRSPKKLITIFLIAAFLSSSLMSLFGFIWCDKGTFSDIHITNHMDGHAGHQQLEGVIDYHTAINIGDKVILLDRVFSEPGDSCIDLPIELSFALVEETESVKPLTDAFIVRTRYKLENIASPGLFTNNLILETRPRISQTILLHRTVVLLS